MSEYKSLRMPSPDQADIVKAKILDFQITRAGSMEYILEDETAVRFTPQLSQVLVQVDEDGNIVTGPNGTPIFTFSFNVQTQVMPKNRTLFVPRQQPSQGSTSSTVTL